MLPENVQLVHQDEERFRAQNLEFIERSQALADHLELIHDSMYVLLHFCREHRHRNNDELAIQLLGVRMFNTAASALKLALSGYHQPAFQLLRDLLETTNLLDYFRIEPGKIAEWRVADDKGQKVFDPVKVRLALEAHPSHVGERRDLPYKRLSTYAAHPTFRGFRLLAEGSEFRAGPFVDAGLLGDWLLETAAWLGHGTLVFSEHLHPLALDLQADRAVLASEAVTWRGKYLVAAQNP